MMRADRVSVPAFLTATHLTLTHVCLCTVLATVHTHLLGFSFFQDTGTHMLFLPCSQLAVSKSSLSLFKKKAVLPCLLLSISITSLQPVDQ